MAGFRMIVAVLGELEDLQSRLTAFNYGTVTHEASDEASAHEVALDHFEDDARRSDWELDVTSIESYEILNQFAEVIGWRMLAEGSPITV